MTHTYPQLIGASMLIAPVAGGLGFLLAPLFTLWDRRAWVVFILILIYYGIAFALVRGLIL